MINEDQLIQSLPQYHDGVIGDDAAVIPGKKGHKQVITKDLLVENQHFRTDYCNPEDLAHKALQVNLSDIAAMGAKPQYVLCGIAIPKRLHLYAQTFLAAFAKACQEAKVVLIGGDTTASSQHLFISITAIGLATKKNLKYRNAAQIGDGIAVIGNLGHAHLGWLNLEKHKNTNTRYTQNFLRPQAKNKEGVWLAKQPFVTSMMDISDGLYIDLRRLALSAKKKAVLDMDSLSTQLDPEIPLQTALAGGEDYGLLITIRPHALTTLAENFTRKFGYPLKIVGHISEGEGVCLMQGNQPFTKTIDYFTHFGENHAV